MPATPVTITTIDVAQAVADEMNAPAAGTVFEMSFVCARMWLPTFSLVQTTTNLQIAVIAISEEDDRVTRNLVERMHLVRLCFQRKLDPTAPTYSADIDAHAAFVFQVKDYWMAARKKLLSASTPNVFTMRAKVVASNNPMADAEKGTFAAILDLTFVERTPQ